MKKITMKKITVRSFVLFFLGVFMGVAGLVVISNRLSWVGITGFNNPWDHQVTTISGVDAGRKYLQAIFEPISTDQFLKKMAVLVDVPRWNFINDDSSLYLRGGILNNPDPNPLIWSIPIGSLKVHTQEALEMAKKDLDSGMVDSASAKIEILLKVSKHLEDHPQFISFLIGHSIIAQISEFTVANRQIMTPSLKSCFAGVKSQEVICLETMRTEGPLSVTRYLQSSALWQYKYYVDYAWLAYVQESWMQCLSSGSSLKKWKRDVDLNGLIRGQVLTYLLLPFSAPTVDIQNFKKTDSIVAEIVNS